MDWQTILGIIAWWAFGFGVDIATHWAIFKEMKTYGWLAVLLWELLAQFGLWFVILLYGVEILIEAWANLKMIMIEIIKTFKI